MALAVAGGLVALAAGAAWGQINESFDDWVPLGWRALNRSQFPSEPDGWHQAFFDPFWAHSDPSYAGSSTAANTQTGIISTWLTSPTVDLHNGDSLDFWVRSVLDSTDRLQVRMSTAGTNGNPGSTPTSVGVFTTLLMDINPTYVTGGFPSDWTRYTVHVTGLAAPTTGKFAFRHFVDPAGSHAPRGEFVGVDDVLLTPLLPGTGACCKPDGTCVQVTSAECVYQNGVYSGDGVACWQAQCAGTESCCLPDGNTVQLTWWACDAAGGHRYPWNPICPTLDCYSVTGLFVNVHPSGIPGWPGIDTIATLDIPWQGGQLITGSLSVGVDIESAWQGVYRARIVHPDGTTVQLITLPGVVPPKVADVGNWGFSTQNFGGGGQMMSFVDNAPAGVYDSAAGYPGPPRATQTGMNNVVGSWAPSSGTLSQFNGKPIGGRWTLIVNDDGSGTSGFIHGFRVCVPHTFCYANLDHTTAAPCLNVFDFAVFLNLYAAGDPRANCDGSTVPPVLNVLDFSCFLNSFSSCTAC